MTVAELLALLKELPPHASVQMAQANDDALIPLLGVGMLRDTVYLSPKIWLRPSVALAHHRDSIVGVLAKHGFSNPRVFGSVLHGSDTELSDLDLLVDPGVETTLFSLGGAIADLNASLGIRVDLQTPQSLPDSFRDAVLAEARAIGHD